MRHNIAVKSNITRAAAHGSSRLQTQRRIGAVKNGIGHVNVLNPAARVASHSHAAVPAPEERIIHANIRRRRLISRLQTESGTEVNRIVACVEPRIIHQQMLPRKINAVAVIGVIRVNVRVVQGHVTPRRHNHMQRRIAQRHAIDIDILNIV